MSRCDLGRNKAAFQAYGKKRFATQSVSSASSSLWCLASRTKSVNMRYPVGRTHLHCTSPNQIIFMWHDNSMAWVRERTKPTERPPLVGVVGANFCGLRVPRGQCEGSLWPYYRLPRPEPLLFLPSSSSFVFTMLNGLRSRPTTTPKIW
jgi:hypothetical protein